MFKRKILNTELSLLCAGIKRGSPSLDLYLYSLRGIISHGDESDKQFIQLVPYSLIEGEI